MLKRFLFAVIPLILVFSQISHSQVRKFDLTVIIDKDSEGVSSSAFPISIRILNRAEETLDLKGLRSVNFYFSECVPGDAHCKDSGGLYFASAQLPAKKLRENEQYEIHFDAAALKWQKGPFNTQSYEPFARLGEIPLENIYFFADIKILDGFVAEDYGGKRTPTYREYVSNFLSIPR